VLLLVMFDFISRMLLASNMLANAIVYFVPYRLAVDVWPPRVCSRQRRV
jgi:hypothetical protein